MQPVGYDTVCIHQVSDCLQHGLEIVLFWLSSHDNIECLVYILQYVNRWLDIFINICVQRKYNICAINRLAVVKCSGSERVYLRNQIHALKACELSY